MLKRFPTWNNTISPISTLFGKIFLQHRGIIYFKGRTSRIYLTFIPPGSLWKRLKILSPLRHPKFSTRSSLPHLIRQSLSSFPQSQSSSPIPLLIRNQSCFAHLLMRMCTTFIAMTFPFLQVSTLPLFLSVPSKGNFPQLLFQDAIRIARQEILL